MKYRYNFALGALLAVGIMIPTVVENASATPKDNAIASFAEARSWVEGQVSCSYRMVSARLADWLKQAAN